MAYDGLHRLSSLLILIAILHGLVRAGDGHLRQCWRGDSTSDYVRIRDLFPAALRPPPPTTSALTHGFDFFNCWITPVFVGALEDTWTVHLLDLFLPVFLVIVLQTTLEARRGRAGGERGGTGEWLLNHATSTLALMQLVTVAAVYNALAPLYKRRRQQRGPVSLSREDASGLMMQALFILTTTASMYGLPKWALLWGIAFFQYSIPMSTFFLQWPLRNLAAFLFKPLFATHSRVSSQIKLWESISTVVALLHLLALARILATVVTYDTMPFTFALENVHRPPFDLWRTLQYELSGSSYQDLGRRILALDWFFATLAVVMVLLDSPRKESRLSLACRTIILGPGNVFALTQRDLALDAKAE